MSLFLKNHGIKNNFLKSKLENNKIVFKFVSQF